MGTKGSYTGGGGKAGKDLRDAVSKWADIAAAAGNNQPRPALPPAALRPALRLFRSGADGPGGGGRASGAGGGGGGGGAQRSVAASARAASRAAAAAYGLRTGDAQALADLGLDYNALRANQDPLQVTKAIVDAACGPLADGTIEDHEQRLVAAEIAGWILDAHSGGSPPTPDEIVRETIALIIFEAACTETAARLQQGDPSATAILAAEDEMRATARVLAGNAELSATGATEQELNTAIAKGIESLRVIWGDA
ncbi:hypothetical protein ABZ780_29120 [Micromonospora sp. NPDC047467]|uniref:hypothetical protein n=1 Tax=Micromonospora sp. NPDC047467 TaxID=3154814 RepID=UPI00340706C5